MARAPADNALFRWTDLRKRAISAALLAPVALACVWLGATPWTVLMAAAMAGLAIEWVTLCGRAVRALPGAWVPIAVLAAGAVAVFDREDLALLVMLAGAALIWLTDHQERGASRLALGVVYIGLPAIALIWLRGDSEAGRANVLFIVLIVWASDIGAYLAGRLIGGPKLAPLISPGKTWSGAAGGLVAATIVGLAAAEAQAVGRPAHILGIAVLLGAVSQAGDLLESFIKRRFGVKDSGRLIPGHGGLLDRLDGLLAAAPVAALLALSLGRGVNIWQ